MEKAAGFGWLRLFCIQLAPTQLIRRMGAGLVIVYGLGLTYSPALHGRLFIPVGLVDVFPHVEGHWGTGSCLRIRC